MANGFQMLGNVLAGGIDREGAFAEGRFQSAKTNAAIQQAALDQAKAQRELDDAALRRQIAKDPLVGAATPEQAARLTAAGLGDSFAGLSLGQERQQEIGFRNQIADPATGYDQLQRNRAALGDNPFNVLTVNDNVVTDARNPDAGAKVIPGANVPKQQLGTTAERNFATLEGLIRAGSLEQAKRFTEVLGADKIADAGGVPTVVPRFTLPAAPVAGSVPPVAPPPTPAAAPPAAAAPSKLPTAADVAANKRTTAGASTAGQLDAKKEAARPQAEAQRRSADTDIDKAIATADKILNDPDANFYATGLGSSLTGQFGAGARGRNNIATLKSQLTLGALKSLKQTGASLGYNPTDRDAKILESAEGALSEDLSSADSLAQVQAIRDALVQAKANLDEGFRTIYGSGNVFATEAEAEAAAAAGKIKSGDKITIAGQTGTWE